MYGSEDTDPHPNPFQNVTDPEHCLKAMLQIRICLALSELYVLFITEFNLVDLDFTLILCDIVHYHSKVLGGSFIYCVKQLF